MKKSIKFSIIVIALIICSIAPFPSFQASAIDNMPDTYISYDDFYKQINNNIDNIEINVIGDYDFETSFTLWDEEGRICNNFDLSEKIQAEVNYSFKITEKSDKGKLKAIVVSNDEAKKHGNFESKEKIEEALEQGYLAIFMIDDLLTGDVIFSRYTGAKLSTKSVDDNDSNIPYACYVAKNNIGEYFTGTFYVNTDACGDSKDKTWDDESLKKMKDETILYHAWCLRDLNYYTRNSDAFKEQMEQKSIDFGAIKASASTGSDIFSIGSEWKSICGGWHQNIIGSGSNKPSFWEWINFLYLKNGESGNHYYAWAIDYSAAPNGGVGTGTAFVDYRSDAAKYMSKGKLRSHYPTSTPSNGSYNYSFGAAISSSGTAEANIGFSRTVSTSDLKIVDTTNINYGKIRFFYKIGPFNQLTKYAKNTSNNSAIFIYKDEDKTGHYTFHHYREGAFHKFLLGISYSGNWYTTYYK